MSWARRILITVSVVVAIFVLAVVLLFTVDLGYFKSNVEDYVSQKIGRQLVIAGAFEPALGSTIDLVAEDVTLSNADWGVAENILELTGQFLFLLRFKLESTQVLQITHSFVVNHRC